MALGFRAVPIDFLIMPKRHAQPKYYSIGRPNDPRHVVFEADQ
jgi:hypothetical protein